jgi:hypothetical protein
LNVAATQPHSALEFRVKAPEKLPAAVTSAAYANRERIVTTFLTNEKRRLTLPASTEKVAR